MKVFSALNNFIKQFDIFGVPLQLSIQSKDKLFQSTWGGLMTVLIYAASLLYSIQLIYQWFTWQIAPQVTSQSNLSNGVDGLQLEMIPFRLSFIGNGVDANKLQHISDNRLSLFNYEVSVFGTEALSDKVYSGIYNYDECGRDDEQFDYAFSSICPNLTHKVENNLIQTKLGYADTYVYYEVKYCDPKQDQRCYGKDKIMNGKTKENMWELVLFRQEVNLQTGEVFLIQKPYYLQFDNDTSKFLNIQLKITKAVVDIDTGFILSSPKRVVIVKDVQPFITLDPCYNKNQGPSISLSLEKYYLTISITFPQFTLILSQIISFFQTLVLCGFLINLLNSSQMEEFMKLQLLQIYFPQFKDIKEKKNLFGKITQASYGNQVIEGPNIQELQEKKNKILELVQSRLNIFYLIQDVNQLQIAIQSISPKHPKRSYYLSILEKEDHQNQFDEHDFFQAFENEKKEQSKVYRSSDSRTHPEPQDMNDFTAINLESNLAKGFTKVAH